MCRNLIKKKINHNDSLWLKRPLQTYNAWFWHVCRPQDTTASNVWPHCPWQGYKVRAVKEDVGIRLFKRRCYDDSRAQPTALPCAARDSAHSNYTNRVKTIHANPLRTHDAQLRLANKHLRRQENMCVEWSAYSAVQRGGCIHTTYLNNRSGGRLAWAQEEADPQSSSCFFLYDPYFLT